MGAATFPDRRVLGLGRLGTHVREPVPRSRRRGNGRLVGATASTSGAGPGIPRSRCSTSRRPSPSTPSSTCGGGSCRIPAARAATAAATRWSSRSSRTGSTRSCTTRPRPPTTPCRCRRCSAATRRMSTASSCSATPTMDLLENGRIPAPDEAQVGNEEELEPKAFGVPQNKGDIYVLRWCGAGGYGDPLDREPDAVARDVAAGAVSAEAAEKFYAVVPRRRRRRRSDRGSALGDGRGAPAAGPAAPVEGSDGGNGGSPAAPVGPGLQLRDGSLSCGNCGSVLARRRIEGRRARERAPGAGRQPARPTRIASSTTTSCSGSSPARAASGCWTPR